MRRIDDRGVSSALGYVLTLGISAVLISGLLLAGGNFTEVQREEVTHSELEVVGQRLALHVASADRAAMTVGPDGHLSVRTDLPDRVAGTGYRIEITEVSPPGDGQGSYAILLSTRTPDITVSVTVRTTTPLNGTSVDGGPVRIVYRDLDGDGDANALEVTHG